MTTTPMIGHVISGWGKRKALIPGMSTYHRGVDIVAPTGTVVVAPQAGTVTVATYNPIRGHYIVVDHGGGWATEHQHLSKRLASVGTRVAEGSTIGLCGRTGNVTGVHLHTEVRYRGVPIDPTPWYAARGVTLGVAVAVLPAHTTAPEEDDMYDESDRTRAAAIETKLDRQDLLYTYFETTDGRLGVASSKAPVWMLEQETGDRDRFHNALLLRGLLAHWVGADKRTHGTVLSWSEHLTNDGRTPADPEHPDVVQDPRAAFGSQIPWAPLT